MRTQKPKQSRAPTKQEGGRALYVYCVVRSNVPEALFNGDLPDAIEPDAKIELIVEKDLAAVISTLPVSDYGEAALQAQLADPAWTATRAMRHERVVEYFAKQTEVVPLRFGVIYLERSGVRSMLDERAGELRSILSRLKGREEWGINVYCDPTKLSESLDSLSPELHDLVERAKAASPGEAYLLGKKLEALRIQELRVYKNRVISAVQQDLSAVSDAAVRLRVLAVDREEMGETAAKFAFLIDRSRFERFRAEAERLAAEHAESGFRLELTGPWPAYNFAASDDESQE